MGFRVARVFRLFPASGKVSGHQGSQGFKIDRVLGLIRLQGFRANTAVGF